MPINDDFQQARTLFVQGIADFEAGRFEDARAAFESSLAVLPDRVSTLTNLAATHIELRNPRAALPLLDAALASRPGDQDGWWHRAVAMGDLGRFEDALTALETFLALRPGHAGGWVRHGQALQHLDRHAQALPSYDKGLAIDPTLAQVWTTRGNILKDLRRLDEAALSYTQAITHGGDTALNRYFLAAVQGRGAPPSAPAQYVQGLFDSYAADFDAHLVEVLKYEAHAVLLRGLTGLHPATFEQALDLGCGTGLCAPLARPLTRHLHGVDLSPAMLEKARALQLYDHLEQADAAHYLRSTDQRYDLVLAADVFIYIGDLDAVFTATARVMDAGGMFCFSIELADASAAGFALKDSLRYGHSEAYGRRLAALHGFDVVKTLQHAIREDQCRPIDGMFMYLHRI